MEAYQSLIKEMKQLIEEGDIRKAVQKAEAAQELNPTDKLGRKIGRMKDYLANNTESDSDDEMVEMENGFCLYSGLYKKLYPYQREGVLWLWKLFLIRKGGVLGDDMGLGKTIQIIAFLSGMFDLEKINHVLIVMPVSLVPNWKKEFDMWAPGIDVLDFAGSKTAREKNLLRIQRKKGVVITTYGLVSTNYEQLSSKDYRQFVWDYVILDEGHKIKNPTKTTKSLHQVPARNRIILTGTPLQNNLREMWSLFDFAHQGTLLGTSKTFKHEYEHPITRGREKDATIGEKRLGMAISRSLQATIAPYFLRRTKEQVLERGSNNSPRQIPALVSKNDFVIWLFLSQIQLKIYSDFLKSEDVQSILMTKHSPLVQLTVLKKICDHPRLLSDRACRKLGLDRRTSLEPNIEINVDNINDDDDDDERYSMRIDHVSDRMLIKESGKLSVLLELVKNLSSEGHRCLIFSQSRKMLNIIQRILTNNQMKVQRIDGTVISRERHQRVEQFQTSTEYNVFLLTTQTGGVGLTLTGADRVIIYDPSWNPAVDSQAVDRVYRIGQNRSVIVYRLITCGTVEEKIYRRQIFKDSINRQTTGDSTNPVRYFSKQELRELFMFDCPNYSTTQKQLEQMHSAARKTSESLDEHVAFLHTLDIFGISDHDLMFRKNEHEEVEGDVVSNEFYETRVNAIENRMQLETQLINKLNEGGNSLHYRFAKNDPASRPREYLGAVPESVLNTSLESLHLAENYLKSAAKASNQLDCKSQEANKENIIIDLEDDELPTIDWNQSIKEDQTSANTQLNELAHEKKSFAMLEKPNSRTSIGSHDDPICIVDSRETTPSNSPRNSIILVEESDTEQDEDFNIECDSKEMVEDSFNRSGACNKIVDDSFESDTDKGIVEESFENTSFQRTNNDKSPVSLSRRLSNGYSEPFNTSLLGCKDKERRRSRRSVASSIFKVLNMNDIEIEEESNSIALDSSSDSETAEDVADSIVVDSSDSETSQMDNESNTEEADVTEEYNSDDDYKNGKESELLNSENEVEMNVSEVLKNSCHDESIGSNNIDESDQDTSGIIKRPVKRKMVIRSESESDDE